MSLLAQNEIEKNNTVMSDQLNEWMNKISSNSEMRSQMKLVDSFTRDPEWIKMIIATMPKEASGEYSLKSEEIMDDSVKVIKELASPIK